VIELVLGFVLVTGLAALRDTIEIDFPAEQCYDRHCSMPLREGLDWGVCHSACRLEARALCVSTICCAISGDASYLPLGRTEHLMDLSDLPRFRPLG
jgi:hypothetical protein